jgi:hypothetical protein
MAFAQLTYRESLRDIEACLRSMGGKLYHMGFRGRVARTTLADANECHDWRIYADFAQILIGIARPLWGLRRSGTENRVKDFHELESSGLRFSVPLRLYINRGLGGNGSACA